MRSIVILSDRSRMKITPPLFSIFVVLGAGSAQAQDPVARGQALVAEFCGRCHAIGVKGKSRHSDAPPFRNLGRSVDLDEFPRTLEREYPAAIPTCLSSSSATTMRSRSAPICA